MSHCGAHAGLQRLECISVPKNNLTAFPSTLCNLPALNTLDLSANALVTLPQDLSNLTCLKSLRISENNIVALHVSLSSIQKLTHLSARDNPISAALSNPQAQSRNDTVNLIRELLSHSQDPSAVRAAGVELVFDSFSH